MALQRTPLLLITSLRIQLRSTTTIKGSYILRERWKKGSQLRKRKKEVTNDLGVELEERFDLDSQSDFNDDIDGDEDSDDENM